MFKTRYHLFGPFSFHMKGVVDLCLTHLARATSAQPPTDLLGVRIIVHPSALSDLIPVNLSPTCRGERSSATKEPSSN